MGIPVRLKPDLISYVHPLYLAVTGKAVGDGQHKAGHTVPGRLVGVPGFNRPDPNGLWGGDVGDLVKIDVRLFPAPGRNQDIAGLVVVDKLRPGPLLFLGLADPVRLGAQDPGNKGLGLVPTLEQVIIHGLADPGLAVRVIDCHPGAGILHPVPADNLQPANRFFAFHVVLLYKPSLITVNHPRVKTN